MNPALRSLLVKARPSFVVSKGVSNVFSHFGLQAHVQTCYNLLFMLIFPLLLLSAVFDCSLSFIPCPHTSLDLLLQVNALFPEVPRQDVRKGF